MVPNGCSCDTAGAWSFSWKEFKKIDSLAAANGLTSEYYLGWPNKGQIQQVASRSDRILLHAYRTNDVDVYQYSKNRLIDACLLYTSDAADERSSVDLGGRRIINKKKKKQHMRRENINSKKTKNQKRNTA